MKLVIFSFKSFDLILIKFNLLKMFLINYYLQSNQLKFVSSTIIFTILLK